MNAKEYLEQVRFIQTRLKALTAEVERLRTEAESTGINLDAMPKGSGEPDKIARLAAQLADCETTLQNEMSGLWSMRMRIIGELGQLRNYRHHQILYLRYVKCESWEHIAYDMGITWRHCYRLHGSALQEFEEVINGNK